MNLYEIKALTAHNKINDLANKTAVTLSHTFADNIARDTYFTDNPTELVDNLFIKVGAGYQQYAGSAWEEATAVVADLSGIESELTSVEAQINTLDAELNENTKHYQITTEEDTTYSGLDIAHYGRTNNKIAFVVHNYTDGRVAQFDNVGSNTILQLVNANNPERRTDKTADYVGTGDFLYLAEFIDGANRNLFSISKDVDFFWSGIKNTAFFTNSKAADSKFGFEFRTSVAQNNIFRIGNGAQYVVSFKNDQPVDGVNTRAVIESFVGQTSGMLIEAKAGVIRIKSANKNTYLDDNVILGSGLKFATFADADAPLNTFFLDSTNLTLKYKDNSGVVKTVSLV